MKNNYTGRGKTQKIDKAGHKNSHSRGMLSGIFNACRCKTEEKALLNRYVEYPRQKPSGMTLNGTMNHGFTLIELLVVVLIIGILAAVAVPQYEQTVKKSRLVQAIIALKAITDAQEVYFLANGVYTTRLEELDVIAHADSEYFRYGCTCRYCVAAPKKEGYPFVEFHLSKMVCGASEKWLRKHWCHAASLTGKSKEQALKLCKIVSGGVIDPVNNYYLLN